MTTLLQKRFENMNNFLPDYVTNFICETGIDNDVNFISEVYTNYKREGDDTLYCHPIILGYVLQRLKGYIGVKSFTTYTNVNTKHTQNIHNFLSTFLKVCSIKDVDVSITHNVQSSDISYIFHDINIDTVSNIIDKTKNIIFIQDINRVNLLELLETIKRHHVIAYYNIEGLINPETSIAVVMKDFNMFD